MNAEFQRIARKDKKDFLSDECKEIEKNNSMGKTRDLFKKLGEIKGVFPTRMRLIKDRNGKDLTEAEKLRSGKNTEKKYTKKIFMTQMMTMVYDHSPRARHSGM